MKAISIRQPWAHLIVRGGKDVENRNWQTRYRGRILIHAAQGMTRAEYHEACMFVRDRFGMAARMEIPLMYRLWRGGYVGVAELVECERHVNSPWFFGPYGFVLRHVHAIPFVKATGSLGVYESGCSTEEVDRWIAAGAAP